MRKLTHIEELDFIKAMMHWVLEEMRVLCIDNDDIRALWIEANKTLEENGVSVKPVKNGKHG